MSMSMIKITMPIALDYRGHCKWPSDTSAQLWCFSWESLFAWYWYIDVLIPPGYIWTISGPRACLHCVSWECPLISSPPDEISIFFAVIFHSLSAASIHFSPLHFSFFPYTTVAPGRHFLLLGAQNFHFIVCGTGKGHTRLLFYTMYFYFSKAQKYLDSAGFSFF